MDKKEKDFKEGMINQFKNYIGWNSVFKIESQFLKNIDDTKNEDLKKLLFNDYFDFFDFRNKLGYDLTIETPVLYVIPVVFNKQKDIFIDVFKLDQKNGYPLATNYQFTNYSFTKNIEQNTSYSINIKRDKNNKWIQTLMPNGELFFKNTSNQLTKIITEFKIDLDVFNAIEFKNNVFNTTDIGNHKEIIELYGEVWSKIPYEIQLQKNNFNYFDGDNISTGDESNKIKIQQIMDGSRFIKSLNPVEVNSETGQFQVDTSIFPVNTLALDQMMKSVHFVEEKMLKYLYLRRDNEFTTAQKNKEQILFKEEDQVNYLNHKRLLRKKAWKRLFIDVISLINPKMATKELDIELDIFELSKKAALDQSRANRNLLQGQADLSEAKVKETKLEDMLVENED